MLNISSRACRIMKCGADVFCCDDDDALKNRCRSRRSAVCEGARYMKFKILNSTAVYITVANLTLKRKYIYTKPI